MIGVSSATPEPQDELVLEAKSDAEFIEMMRRMLAWSGRTAGQVATYANLPRSTAYHFVSPKNAVLPKDPHQVEAFARACKLSRDQVNQVMRIWDRLSNTAMAIERHEIVEAELVEGTVVQRMTPVLPRLAGGSSGTVAVHGDINIIYHTHASGGGDDDAGRGGAGGNSAGGDDGENPTPRGRTTRARSSETFRTFLLDLLGSRVWVVHTMLLLGMLGMLLFGLLAVLTRRIEALIAVMVFFAMTAGLLRLVAQHKRL